MNEKKSKINPWLPVVVMGVVTILFAMYLVVAENWDPNWRATIDGKPAPVLRAQNTLLSVVLAPDAREVTLEFASPAYRRGRLISILSAIGVLALFAAPLMTRRTRPNG